MSHTTTLKSILFRDPGAMQQAVDELNSKGIACQLVRNAKPRMYFSNQHGNCDFVLKLQNGRYDVGFDKQEDGSYAPVFDVHAGYVSGQIGAACPLPNTEEGRAQHAMGKFTQAYAKYAAINAAMAQGYMLEGEPTFDDKGNVHLSLAVI